jgi:nucleotide-binding universal stress UspA family protein
MMHKSKLVVAAVDLGPSTEAVITQAIASARSVDGVVQVFHCIDSLVLDDLSRVIPVAEEKLRRMATRNARKALEKVGERIAGFNRAQIIITVGTPFVRLFHDIRFDMVDLLVVGWNGLHKTEHGAGVFATNCVRKFPADVLAVDGSQLTPFKSIAVAIDWSEHARDALRVATKIATRDGSLFHCVHFHHQPWLHFPYRLWEEDHSVRNQELSDADLKARVAELLGPSRVELGTGRVQYKVLEGRTPAAGIIEYVETFGVELLVLGSKGRRNSPSMRLGGTVQKILRYIHCSVLVTKTDLA